MKTKQLFAAILLVGLMSACTMDEMETNQINLKKLEIFEQKEAETAMDTILDRTGQGEPPKD